MNIFAMLLENLFAGPVTVRFPARPPTSAGYRGLVEYDETRCSACSMCSFVCPSAAIKTKRRKDAYDWSYDPGQCTFCARCVDVCASDALSMQPLCPPVYAISGELKHAHSLARKSPLKKSPAPEKTGASQ